MQLFKIGLFPCACLGRREETEEIFVNKEENIENGNTLYLDKHRLLKGNVTDSKIKSIHREWFIQQAAIFAHLPQADLQTKKQLELLLLNAYSKISTSKEKDYETLEMQTTPLLWDEGCYHRVTRNDLLNKVNEIYARFLGIASHELFIINSPLLQEVFARELPHSDLKLKIADRDNFKDLIDFLFEQAHVGKFSSQRILIDFSQYLAENLPLSKETIKAIVQDFENILLEKLEIFTEMHPSINCHKIIEQLLIQIHLIAFTTYEEQNVLLLPEFLLNPRVDGSYSAVIMHPSMQKRHGSFFRDIDSMISRNGFRLDPAHAKQAWLKLQDSQSIMQDMILPCASFATKGSTFPKVFDDFQEFMQAPVVSKFRNLSQESLDVPYLQILPEATYSLLNGLALYRDHGGVHAVFKSKGIESFLQISYFRMINAMNEAIFKKKNMIAFNNQIELLHQEIQNILAVVQPYDEQALSHVAVQDLTTGEFPIVPPDLERPNVYLKASAMRGLSSILAGIEAEKKDSHLSVLVQKDSYYYASNDNLKEAKNFQLHTLDSHQFNKNKIDQAFDRPPSQPIDLFVCEFHHNILQKQVYESEKVIEQIKSLMDNNCVAEKFTVVIDTTIGSEQSNEIRDLLNDQTIKDLIAKGRFNLVLLRSAQKFDMLGLDNYYGGLVTTFNKEDNFKTFNMRMSLQEDQLKGLNYQGLTHLQTFAKAHIAAFRKAVMQNTQKLYAKLPTEMIFFPETQNPMQISQIQDDDIFFLDIKFPHYPKTHQAFLTRLCQFVEEEKLFFTSRPSFSFINTNLTLINGKIRFSLGLEDEKTLERYAAFMHATQSIIDQVKEMNQSHEEDTKEQIETKDTILAQSIRTMPF